MEHRPSHPLFDCHFHVIDPRFDLIPNQGYLPPAFTVAEYLKRAAPLGIAGGAVVSGSFQGYDQKYLLDALVRLGPAFVGVTQLPKNTPEETICELAQGGVRAIRFNLYRGGSEGVDALEYMAHKVFALARWHIEVYADPHALLGLVSTLKSLPQVVVDHLGMSPVALPTLLALVERGAKVKASGFGRVTVDVRATLRAIAAVDPSALMFGTDLPATRARRPFGPADIALIEDELGPEIARRVLHDNAVALYRPVLQPQSAMNNP